MERWSIQVHDYNFGVIMVGDVGRVTQPMGPVRGAGLFTTSLTNSCLKIAGKYKVISFV